MLGPDIAKWLERSVMGDEYVTLHGKTGTKVIARSQHANTTRLACLMSRICAYLINITMQDTIHRSTEPLVLQILEDQINYKIESKNIPYLNCHRKIHLVAMIQKPIEVRLLRYSLCQVTSNR